MATKEDNGLVSYVYLLDDDGEAHGFGPEDDLPDWALDKMGDHCFVDGKKPAGSGKSQSNPRTKS